MPATEELRVEIRTVADTSGAKQASQALSATQAQAERNSQRLQQLLKSGQSTATALRQVAAGQGTQETAKDLSAVATHGSKAASSVADMAAAFGIATTAAGFAHQALSAVTNAIGSSIDATRTHERVIRATMASYGQQAEVFTRFAQQLSTATGFTSDAILEAALSARTLSQNYGLSIQQTQQLIRVSGDLARIRGIGIAEAFERVQSAIRGEAEASEYLGLTLNDTYIANNAMNGSLKTSFNTMTDQQKAQVRYNELLRQTADFQGLAAGSAESLDTSFRKLETSTNKLQLAFGKMLGPTTAESVNAVAAVTDLLAANLDKVVAGISPLNQLATSFRKLGDDLAYVRKNADASGRFFEDLVKGGSWTSATQAAEKYTHDLQQQQRELKRLKELSDNLPPSPVPTGYVDPDVKRRFDQEARQAQRLRDINELPSRDTAAEMARLAYWDQVDAAVRELTSAQQRQKELQRESVDLVAQEAQIRLSMLPSAERLAAAQRDATEAQIRARQAALPASEALEDLQYEQQRARLIASNRGASVDDRTAARRQLRALARAEPGVALGALEAGRPVTLAGRAVERVGLEQQLFQITNERALAQITLAQETNTLLAQIAEQRTQAIELTINMGSEQFRTEFHAALQVVQAHNPAPIPLVGTGP